MNTIDNYSSDVLIIPLFFKTQLLPNHVMRIAVCDPIGRTFYAEFIADDDSRFINYDLHKYDKKPYNPNDPVVLCGNPDGANVFTDREVSMFGTENMVKKALNDWLNFYGGCYVLQWYGEECAYDVAVIDDLLEEHIIYFDTKPSYKNHGRPDYAINFINPLKFVEDLRDRWL